MSGLTWQTFLDTDFSQLRDVADEWQVHLNRMLETASAVQEIEIVQDTESEDFEGLAASAARSQVKSVTELFIEDLDSIAKRIMNLLYDAADDFEAKQEEVRSLDAEAGSDLYMDGGIGEEFFRVQVPSADTTGGYVQELEEKAEPLSAELLALMADARAIDGTLKADLDVLDESAPELMPKFSDPDWAEKMAERLLDKHADMLDQILAGDTDAAEVSEWWDSLSESEREEFISEHPEMIGPLDGIPTDVRDEANRTLLDQQIDDFSPTLDEDIAAKEEEIADYLESGGDIQVASMMQEELDTLNAEQEKRDGMIDLRDRIEHAYQVPNGGPSMPYYLLNIDGSGDGQAVVAVGNPDTADNVNVYVPGTGADLAGMTGSNNEPGQGDLGRAEKTIDDAYWWAPGESTAAVMWLGYDAPDDLAAATDSKYAEGAADGLSSFVDGIRATDQGDAANLTATGHSYGSTTIGTAARDAGLAVDNMIFVGSPGTGVDEAADLGIDPDNVWASRNEEDIIGWANPGALVYQPEVMVHGTDPISEEFGGNTFTSDAPREGGGENHKAYWDDGNVARENMAYIITGQDGRVT